MTGRTRYQREYFLSKPDGIVIRVGFNLERGRVREFTVRLECWLDGRWRPAVGYDTAHARPTAHPAMDRWRREERLATGRDRLQRLHIAGDSGSHRPCSDLPRRSLEEETAM